MSIRILLVDDHKIVRDGLRSLIEKQPDLEVVAEADNGRQALSQLRAMAPDVVIIDVAMPDLNGVDATRRIVADFPRIKVIALSMHSDRRFVSGMLAAGASGYLLKDCAFEELNFAIRTVVRNQTYLSPSISKVLVDDYRQQLENVQAAAPPALTAREREVLQLLAEGRTTKQIAFLLNISVKTVESYRQKIMDKLDMHTVAELTKYAIREGLVSLDG